jgi:glycosyltransferase involved in cell wall biosynthesis
VHWLFPTGVIGLLAARLRGIPVVVYAHGDDVMVTPWRNPIYRWVSMAVCRLADVVLTNSAASARWVDRLGAKAMIIPPGVDLQQFYPTGRPLQRRVLYLGGSFEGSRKGLDIALELADTLVGPGLKDVTPADIPELIRRHDIVLMPSRMEAFGLVAAEAIACGRWVVASAVDGLLDIVEDGVNGTLVHNEDFRGALESIPDYDPEMVSASAARFDARAEQRSFAALWGDVIEKRRLASLEHRARQV